MIDASGHKIGELEAELPAEEEKAVFAHYDLPYEAAPSRRRPARR